MFHSQFVCNSTTTGKICERGINNKSNRRDKMEL